MTATATATRYVYDFAEGSRDMRVAARRQGREHRRDDPRARARARARRVHDHHRGVRRVHARRPRRAGGPGGADRRRHRAAGGARRAARLGDPDDPLLVSVRSGARDSMPGMLETILDLGLNDASVLGLAARTGDEHFAWDSYRRFVQMFGNVVRGVPGERYEESLARPRATRRRARGPRLARGAAARAHRRFQHALRGAHRRGVPAGPARAAAAGRSAPSSTPGWATAPSPTAASTTSPTTGARRSTCSRWCSATAARARRPASRSRATS